MRPSKASQSGFTATQHAPASETQLFRAKPCYEKTSDSAFHGFHCIYFSRGTQGVSLQGLGGFLEGRGVTDSLADPGIPDLHRMLLLCNSRIMTVIINTRRGVRVVKTIVITHGAMC